MLDAVTVESGGTLQNAAGTIGLVTVENGGIIASAGTVASVVKSGLVGPVIFNPSSSSTTSAPMKPVPDHSAIASAASGSGPCPPPGGARVR